MSSVYKRLMNRASFSSLKSAIKSTLSTPMISRSYTCSSSKFFFPIRTCSSQIRHFSLTSSPSERLSAESLLPLHNAVSAARMSTSCLSKNSRGCRSLTKGRTGNSAGRNSKGRITIFHRGGGAKRLHRQIDLKRSTSSLGIVERIEYDPNRSSRIAAVRWIEGAQLGSPSKCNSVENFACPQKILEPTTTTIASPFMFSSLPGMVDQRQVPWSKSPFSNTGLERKKTCLKDVFFSAFSSPKVKGESASLSYVSSFTLPRIAVAGAKPAFFAPRIRDEVRGKNTSSLCKIRKLRTDSTVWAHRLKRKAAVSWNGSRLQETLALVRAAERKERRGKVGQVSKADRAPVTYVIASHQLEEGKMVMNYGSKPSTSHLFRTGLNAA